MKIAVTYDNGNIFQHFGKTENFKVYEVEDNQVVSSEVIGSNGTGHGALAGLLSEQGVDVLICGGIGGGAQAALAEAGVELCSGAEGDVDAAVEAYLNGTLTSAGATCDHHDHEEGHSCGDHCGSHEEEAGSLYIAKLFFVVKHECVWETIFSLHYTACHMLYCHLPITVHFLRRNNGP